MSLEPPPRIVDKFVNIWRDWLYFFWEFVDSHTGGSTPTPPATGASWNAHGNTATGTSTDPLLIKGGSFAYTDTSLTSAPGDTPTEIQTVGTHMAFIPSKAAFRAGGVSGTQWADANIGDYSTATGRSCAALGLYSVSMGDGCSADATGSVAIGRSAVSSVADGLAFGSLAAASGGAGSIAIGSQSKAQRISCVSIGNISKAGGGVATSNCVAIGGQAQATGNLGISLGYVIYNGADTGLALGTYLWNRAERSITIGSGRNVGGGFPDSTNFLMNNQANSLYMGINSNIPTFIMTSGDGTENSTGFIGIVETNPLSTLDVGGSVGYKYSPINATDEPYTIGANNNELTFIVDTSTFGTGIASGFNLFLPKILSTAVDRRMYHFVNSHGLGSAGNHDIALIPAEGDYIYQGPNSAPVLQGPLLGDGTDEFIAIGRGNSAQLLATFSAYDPAGGTSYSPMWYLI